MPVATAIAHSNIALIKYWGKRTGSPELNLPAVGSISLTLGALTTTTKVTADGSLADDTVSLRENGADVGALHGKAAGRITRFLDRIRDIAGDRRFAAIETENDFPTGAGLASSASGFAALALAAARAYGLTQTPEQLSALARCGSGSAARSIYGGFVELTRGERPDGADCVARPIAPEDHWPLHVLVAVTSEAHKEVGSTEGMNLSADTSPFYGPWVDTHHADMEEGKAAILARDFDHLADITEFSTLKMHAVMMSSRPGLVYWNGTTVAVMHEIRRWRQAGTPVCFTMDAGPQVKAFCPASEVEGLRERLTGIDGVLRVIHSPPGSGARIL